VIGGGDLGGDDSNIIDVMASTSPSDDMSLSGIATCEGEIGLLEDILSSIPHSDISSEGEVEAMTSVVLEFAPPGSPPPITVTPSP